jgi:hypothetical protein
VFQVVDTITLEENEKVVNVAPAVRSDPQSGFLLADRMEGQVRWYSADGRILGFAGAKGGGPGEFPNLSAVGRLASGQVLAADRAGRITVFSVALDSVVRTVRVPLDRLEDLETLDDSLVAFTGAAPGREGLDGPRIHIWNSKSSGLIRAFFSPMQDAPNFDAAVIAGWSKIAVRHGLMAAIFATSDTVYLFGFDGTPQRKLPLPSRRFRRVPEGSGPRGPADPLRAAEWLSTFDLMADVTWMSDTTLAVTYQSVQPTAALDRVWHLIGVTLDGRGLFEIPGSPKLLAADPGTGRFYFQNPGSMVPNRWHVARVRTPEASAGAAAVVVGDSLPEAVRRRLNGRAGLRAVWILRTRDCMTCQSFDYELRRLQARHGTTVPITVVHIAPRSGDRDALRAFLGQRRVSADVVEIAEEDLPEAWRHASTPELYLAGQDRVLWVGSRRAPSESGLAAPADSAAAVLLSGGVDPLRLVGSPRRDHPQSP